MVKTGAKISHLWPMPRTLPSRLRHANSLPVLGDPQGQGPVPRTLDTDQRVQCANHCTQHWLRQSVLRLMLIVEFVWPHIWLLQFFRCFLKFFFAFKCISGNGSFLQGNYNNMMMMILKAIKSCSCKHTLPWDSTNHQSRITTMSYLSHS